MCLQSHHLNNIKRLNYTPVGLGKNEFSSEWLKDSTGLNISQKNSYYGEYTFYYWFWKNHLEELEDNAWIGFTGYRYHWSQENNISSDKLNKIINKENFMKYVQSCEKYDMKATKRTFLNLVKKPNPTRFGEKPNHKGYMNTFFAAVKDAGIVTATKEWNGKFTECVYSRGPNWSVYLEGRLKRG